MESIKTIIHKNHEIRIYLDYEIAINPWEDWDCEPPIMFWADQHLSDYGKTEESILDELQNMEDKSDNIPKLLELANISKAEAENEAEECAITIHAILIDEIMQNWDKNDLNFLEAVANVVGIPCKSGTVVNYHSGARIYYLTVLTSAWYEITGAAKENYQEDLDATINLFRNWVNGEIYGYQIEGEYCDHSCWGYFGNPETSGLLEDAKAEIDADIRYHRKKHQQRLKQLIKKHVPFQYRYETA